LKEPTDGKLQILRYSIPDLWSSITKNVATYCLPIAAFHTVSPPSFVPAATLEWTHSQLRRPAPLLMPSTCQRNTASNSGQHLKSDIIVTLIHSLTQLNTDLLIHNLLLSSISQHGVYSEITTHNLAHTAKRGVNSVENDRLVSLITAMN